MPLKRTETPRQCVGSSLIGPQVQKTPVRPFYRPQSEMNRQREEMHRRLREAGSAIHDDAYEISEDTGPMKHPKAAARERAKRAKGKEK